MGRYPKGMANQTQRDEYVHAEASRMANSGDYSSWWHVEIALERRGFPKAQELLNNPAYRARLDQQCEEAKAKKAAKGHPGASSTAA